MKAAALAGSLLVAAAGAALVLVASGRGAAPSAARTLVRAASLTAASPSGRYRLVARVDGAGRPMALDVHGVTANHGRDVWLHLKVNDGRLAGGTTLRGPELDDLRAGGFVYLRTPLLNAFFPPTTWVRVRADGLHAGADEYRPFQAGPRSVLALAAVATRVRPDGARVLHARLDGDSPLVRRILAGVAGGIPFRSLRLVVSLRPDGTIRTLRLRGRAPDYHLRLDVRALFTPTRYDTIEPPGGGFVFDRGLLGTEM